MFLRTFSFGSLLLLMVGCQADLGAADSLPVESNQQIGKAILFGLYAGDVHLGEDGESVGSILFSSSECGDNIAEVELTLEEGAVLPAAAVLLSGTSLSFDFEDGDEVYRFLGEIVSYAEVDGAWYSSSGAGGAWHAKYQEGSVSDYPCPGSDVFVD